MKHTSIYINLITVLAAGIALVSCAKQNMPENGNSDRTDGTRKIAVSFANGSTKSALEGLQPKFVATDVIKVSNGSATEDCPVDIDGSGNASITTELTGALTMVYPAAAAKMNGNAIEGVLVPTVQDGSFASANICKATIAAGATKATFEQQTAVFKLSVPEKQDAKGVDYVVKSLKVISKNGNIAEGSKEIKVGDGTSTIAAENGFYYVSVLPGETSSNLYVCAGAGARKLTGDVEIAKETMYSVALPVLNGHEYVEITMTVGETTKTYKWATMNLGATKPEDYGWYFSWGGTVGYKRDGSKWVTADGGVELPGGFDWVNCPYQTQNTLEFEFTKFTKYLGSTTSSYKDASATDEDALKTVLDPEDDAARANWHGSWRMPTSAEFQALYDATYWAWDATDKGCYVYAPNPATDAGKYNNGAGTYIKASALFFFPAAGYAVFASLYDSDNGGYWSSSLLSDPCYAKFLFFTSSNFGPYYGDFRHVGQSVRAVSE